MLAKLVNKLAWVIRLLHTLVLHEAYHVLPMLSSELVSILVFCVKAFNDHSEWFHAYLSKRIILAKTTLKLASFWRKESLTLEVIQGRIVEDFACCLFKDVNLHLGGTRSFFSSHSDLLGNWKLTNWR